MGRASVITANERILVIRLGALGDLIFCFQAFHEIRLAHPDAEIAILIREPFAAFARTLPWFDRVIVDTHPTFTKPLAWLRLRKEIASFAPDRVYDLQGKNRQTVLYALLGGPLGPEWSGAAPLCKLPRPWPPAVGMHFIDFMAAQLRAAGVPEAPKPDLAWLDAAIAKYALPDHFMVLVPGCSPDAPHKRWPPLYFAELAQRLLKQNIPCVVVGTAADADAVTEIKIVEPNVIDLCGKTSLFELAGVLRHARGVVGNDTGPVHLAAAVGTPTLALFSGKSKPVWSKPPGKIVSWRQCEPLSELSSKEVFFALATLLQHAKNARR